MLISHQLWVVSLLAASTASAQLNLTNGFLNFTTPTFSVSLVNDSQTLYSLRPNTSSFDFIPADKMTQRTGNGQYHLGDITFRVRAVGATAWVSADSAATRRPVTPLPVSGNILAAANLAPTLPSTSLLNVTRRWVLQDEVLQLLFDLENTQDVAVEIGSLGIPLEFNNIFTGRTAAQTNEQCSLFDPYIGQDAGYVQVTPLLGTLPPLLVAPVGKSPLEGWRFLSESTSAAPYYQSQTFEGLYEWQFHSLGYAQNEWSSVTPWNAPSSTVLQPGQNRTYGVQFLLSPSIREIENTLKNAGRPVAVGVPGYILPQDQTGKLFLDYLSAVQNISVAPEGALTWITNSDGKNGWVGYSLTGHTWGRARLSITYADGTLQTVHYYITKDATQVVSDLGNFLTTSQWFTSSTDPFKRSPSVLSYDREVNDFVRDSARVFISGLSDEAGAGSWLAAVMKQYVQPNAAEVAKLEQYVTEVLWGSLQNSDGTVKKSVYYYEPAKVPDYSYPSNISWGNAWNQADAFRIDRAYNYVHVTAAQWALYRVARNYPDLVTKQTWQWYLDHAVTTVVAMTNGGVGFTEDGLMGETVFKLLLDDLKREGLTANASLVESRMKSRADGWASLPYPFGSEQAWDSTGQEGVYAWATYFNDTRTATNALNSILAYQPTVPHWGYNGNARRYWDFRVAAKIQRIERQIHHYGSGLNALPLISQFEASPNDYYLLRVGYGGLSGPLSNIDQEGFASAAFHSFPDTLKWDAYSSDYGPNFSGHAMGIGTYIINHPDFGWQAFGGNVMSTSPTVEVQIRDSVRRRVYIAPVGALLTLDAGAFSAVSYDPLVKTVGVTVSAVVDGVSGAAAAPHGRLVVEQRASVDGVGILKPTASLPVEAGAYVIPFNSSGTATVDLSM